VSTTNFSIVLRNYAGTKYAEVVEYHNLSYTKRVNEPGLLHFDLKLAHPAVASLTDKDQVEVRRRNNDMGVSRYVDFYGLIRAVNRSYTDHDMVHIVAPGQMCMLGWRAVAWYAGYADRSDFTTEKGETIMNTTVSYNCCAAATVANGREREGATTGLSVEADGAAGNTLDWACHGKNVLTNLQDLAKVAGGDFALVKTGAQTWQYRFYTGQLGTDRSATVTFSVARGNMKNPMYAFDRVDERTVAVVGGQGEGSDRAYVVRTGDDYNASTNNIEGFVNASGQWSTTAGYQVAGDKWLSEQQARSTFTFDVAQTPACFYGQVASGGHYDMGDLVLARYGDNEYTVKITGVTVNVPDPGENEDIKLEMENV